ncbi:MAG: hypothetical protein ACRDN0_27675, partial [Trebonia sp.]
MRSWVFPASVAATCVMIVLGHAARCRLAGRRSGRASPALPPRWSEPVVGLYVLLGSAWILVVHSVLGTPPALLSPPLFVAWLEWAADPPHARFDGLRRS